MVYRPSQDQYEVLNVESVGSGNTVISFGLKAFRPQYYLSVSQPLSLATFEDRNQYRGRPVIKGVYCDISYADVIIKRIKVTHPATLILLTEEEMVSVHDFLGPNPTTGQQAVQTFGCRVWKPVDQSISMAAGGVRWIPQ